MTSSTATDMSALNAPWTVLVHYNKTEDLKKLIAPAWVGTADIRSTIDILQSCLLTLFACIYTALHLDVPNKTAWHRVLLSKLRWVMITLFAPEVSVYMATDQLHQAWKLKSDLRAICKRDGNQGHKGIDFNIDLRYCFFIVMGGIHVDVDHILSIPDLDKGALDPESKPRPFSVRLNPNTIVHLAERGHWIPISDRKIDDKSKADVLQKALVVIQVSWMVMQCIARKAYDLPLSLLEIHTMVHVVCALLLYMCWFKKPLNVQDPEFYTYLAGQLALFPERKSSQQPPPDSMRWVEPTAGSKLVCGDVLPSGLGLPLSGPYHGTSIILTDQFLARWEAILSGYSFENRVEVSQSTEPLPWRTCTSGTQPLYLARLKEFESADSSFYRNMPFGEGKRNMDIRLHRPHDSFWDMMYDLKDEMIETLILGWSWLPPIAVALSASYGGVHLSAWNSKFPSSTEEVMWKVVTRFTLAAPPAAICIFFDFLILACDKQTTAVMPLNVFRIAADFSHLGSIFILLHKMVQLNSCSGISFKSQTLYMLVYVTRYLDLFSTDSIYNFIFKILFLGSQGYIIYLMTNAYKPTNDPNVDTFRVQYLLAGAAVLAVVFPYHYTVSEIMWAFSIWLESVAILPQLFMLQRTGEAETITTHYLFALGSYRALYIPNWIYRYFSETHHKVDTIAIVAGIVQTVLYSDFFYIYYTKVMKGKKFKLPV
ncbi:hypothetical protein ACHAPQ_007944 [Fusarium lateritium]